MCEAFDRQKERLVAIKRCTRVFEDLVDCKRILREVPGRPAGDHSRTASQLTQLLAGYRTTLVAMAT